jgi:hypothetical protein
MEELEIKKEGTKEKNKLSKRDFILVILVILFLSGVTYWNFKTWRKSLGKVELPKFEMPKFEPFPKKEGYKEWTSPDGKIKMKYSADWMEMDMRTLESYIQREIEEKPLFLAQKLVMEKSTFVILTVDKLKGMEGLNVEKILEKMKEDTQKREGEMEILKIESKDKEAIFEAKYNKKNGPVFHSKEKMIIDKEVYLISFFAFEKDFPVFEKEAEEIINSIQLLE